MDASEDQQFVVATLQAYRESLQNIGLKRTPTIDDAIACAKAAFARIEELEDQVRVLQHDTTMLHDLNEKQAALIEQLEAGCDKYLDRIEWAAARIEQLEAENKEWQEEATDLLTELNALKNRALAALREDPKP